MIFIEAGNIIVDTHTMYITVKSGDDASDAVIPVSEESSVSMRGLYCELNGKKVLFDPGPGKWIGSFFPGYHFSSLRNAGNILADEGLNSEDVTDIFLTHLHFDHCAGIFKKKGDLLLPSFPGATLHMSRSQYHQIEKPSQEEKDSFLPGFNRLISKYYDAVYYEEGEHPDFLEDVIISDGHSRGMMLPVISDNGNRYIYVSDLIPTTVNLNPAIVSGYDTNPEVLYREKLDFFSQYKDSNYRLILFHEPDLSRRVINL